MKPQEKVELWMKKNGYDYWPPLSIMARLTEEVGEVARAINVITGPKKAKGGEGLENLEEELGDVLFTISCMANKMGVNLERGFRKALTKH